MSFIQKLKEGAEKSGSIVCMGMDPVIEKIPIKEGKTGKRITKFFIDILEAIKADARPAIVKPNYAFYEQYGMEGLRALAKVIKAYRKEGFMVIMDAKRGDIGKTSAAYAKGIFDFWKVDALTVAPYMGFDSVGPFTDYCQKGKGVYVLCRTSNEGAIDLQGLEAEGKKIFMRVAELIAGKWHKEGVCAVVGATNPEELKIVSDYFVKSGKQIPMLIPGVGAQGGTAADVVKALKESSNPLWLHRINSSSGITYAYEAEKTDDYAGAAARAIKKLKGEIGAIEF